MGILDLDLFSRALRLRWLWYEWTSPNRPWVGTEPPANAVDRQLFRASTVVTLGDGSKAIFLAIFMATRTGANGSLSCLPDLFKLAWRKNKIVQEELVNLNWTRGLWKTQTIEEMANFVKLWDLYTLRNSAMSQTRLHGDKLMARQWPCNPVCVLCNHEQETAAHLILHCPFARLVWEKMEDWTRELVHPPQGGFEIIDWCQKELAQLPKKTRRTKAAFMMYGAWNIWKERNLRIFENKQGTPADVLHEIKMEVEARRLACGGPELP
ncbi:hypothetical protein PAHAL_6G245400 [Panicum hallii]|uniref:Reverse transcriptase zinc-binding domain-containing protein n=1 Tax=Panicum hallii TaxID=206008 RepID=A0A2T8IHG6_9POAL|nr:hypothetical protein PAHAL_6G245400 [Panicum hallii]